jgi:hypothetical protein
MDPAPPSGDAAQPRSVTVDHDGKIDGIYVYRPHDDRRAWTPTDYARLELAEQAPRPALPDPPAPRRARASPRKTMIVLAIIAGAVLVPLAARFGLQLWSSGRSAKASGLIVIDSVPSNARLFINGTEVGRTPYVAPNTFQPGTTLSARIVYPGAQEWTGTFPGGVDTSFTAELQAE